MPLRCVSSWLCTNVFSVHQVSAVTFYFTEEWHSISPLGILIVRTTSSSFAREAAENAASRLKNSAVWGQCHLEHRDVQEWLLAYCLEYAYAKMWKEWSNVGLQDALDWILLFAGWPWGRGRPSGSLSLGSCFHVSSCRNNDKCLEELNAKKNGQKQICVRTKRCAHLSNTENQNLSDGLSVSKTKRPHITIKWFGCSPKIQVQDLNVPSLWSMCVIWPDWNCKCIYQLVEMFSLWGLC